MSITGSEINGMALADFGCSILIGTTPATGIFDSPGKAVTRNGTTIITTEPTLQLLDVDASLVEKNSTVITINGINYQAFEKTPDGAGFVELDLTRDF